MIREDAQRSVLKALTDLAPEVDGATLAASSPLRDQVDLDSMDWLRFYAALEKNLGLSVPEADAKKLVTLDDVVGYVAAHA